VSGWIAQERALESQMLNAMFGGNAVMQAVLRSVEAEETARKQKIANAWRFYFGNLPQPLRVKINQPNDNVLMNYARLIVDKGASFLFGDSVAFTVGDESESPADTWLNACWQANKKEILLHRLAVNGGVCGQVFVKMIAPSVPNGFPRLVVLDPTMVSVLWDPDDFERAVEYKIEWTAINPATGKPVARRQVITEEADAWRILDQESQGDRTRWETLNETLWPFAWPPIFTCQNLPAPNSFWGLSDIEPDILNLLQSRNFVASNLARILRYHAHPKTWGSGFTAQDLRMSVDDIVILPGKDAKLQNLEMTSDLESSLEYLRYLDDQLLSLAHVPPIALGRVDRTGPLSGVALRILYQPMQERTEVKQRLYGELLCGLNRALLELGGLGAEQDCGVIWPEILPVDEQAEAETALLYEQLGVSRDTLMTRLGFDAQAEAAKRAEEDRERAETAEIAFNRGAGAAGLSSADDEA
jgi:hypothetical protein